MKGDKYNVVNNNFIVTIFPQSDAPSRPSSAGYLRAHSRTGWSPVPRSRPSSAEPPDEKLSVPKADSAREVKPKTV